MFNVFIDGREGTTGLRIFERLKARTDINIITIPEELRKDAGARAECLNSSDLSILCLPDEAAVQAVSRVKNDRVRIIDASTAHRTNPLWVYGFPEISPARREEIAKARRVSNPGCYATGFIAAVAPLVKGGFVPRDYPFSATGISGYSGAGKKTIAVYEGENRDIALNSPRYYSLGLAHKHLPEMVKECGLAYSPVFTPIICDYYCGMIVSVPLHARRMLKKVTVDSLIEYFTEYYATHNCVKIAQKSEIPDFLAANSLAGTDLLKIYISGNDDRFLVCSVFDNLGKGASGAAVQNMNIMLGLDERVSLGI